MTPGRVQIALLGPLEVRVDGEAIALGGTKPRSVLAILLSEANHVVSAARLVDELWGEDAPERASNTLQVHVSNLRKALAPAAEALGVREVVQTRAPGYIVQADAALLDLIRFRDLITAAERAVGTRDFSNAADLYRAALTLVYGDPLADLVDEPFADTIRAHVEQMVARAQDALLETDIMVGNHRDALPEIERRVAAEPLNEHLRGLLMIALYRCGRQADALAAFQDARRVLVEELGVDPSPELRDIEARVLAQDPALNSPARGRDDLELRTILRSSVLIPSAVLIVEDGGGAREVDLDRPLTTIGRRVGSDIVFDDPQVSRLHAEVHLEPDGFVVVDRGSTNGTYVNGSHVRQHRLAPGDEIRIADHRLTFQLAER
ncbi:MAG TPA: BTAD domain-containing putative transcriptional regulator [Acidimicrobiia bacterium]|nr:BTAD domain-containing putative transcriptional regulator [Acidimicrobiia bacterium]